MKRVSTKLLQVLIMFFLFLLITGCQYDPYKDKKDIVVETDYFYVQLVTNVKEPIKPWARVLELTELGKEQEILLIPEYVEGIPVEEIGMEMWPEITWGIESENLKKAYVPVTVEFTAQFAFLKCPNLEEFVVLSVPCILSSSISFQSSKGKFISSNPVNEDQLLVCTMKNYFFGPTVPVNLVFHYNYTDAPNSGIYWFDYITGSNLYRLPVDPIKEDTTFTGWYVDEECSIEWDEVLPSSETEIIELYAGWE